MSVLPGFVQYLQCLAGDPSAAIYCHPGPYTYNTNDYNWLLIVMLSSITTSTTKYLIERIFIMMQ